MTSYRPEDSQLRPTTTDTFGVPDNVFGDVPERFYGAIGRVVALGALVEMRLGQVAMELGAATEAEIAGQQTKALLDRIDKIRHSRVEAGSPLPEELLALVNEAQGAMFRRNEVVHSVWPNPTLERALGWRTVRTKMRRDATTPVVWAEADEHSLLALIADLVRIARELRDVVSTTNALS